MLVIVVALGWYGLIVTGFETTAAMRVTLGVAAGPVAALKSVRRSWYDDIGFFGTKVSIAT